MLLTVIFPCRGFLMTITQCNYTIRRLSTIQYNRYLVNKEMIRAYLATSFKKSYADQESLYKIVSFICGESRIHKSFQKFQNKESHNFFQKVFSSITAEGNCLCVLHNVWDIEILSRLRFCYLNKLREKQLTPSTSVTQKQTYHHIGLLMHFIFFAIINSN